MYAVPEDLLAKIPEDYRDPRRIRVYALKHGLKVGARGRISREVYQAYAEQFRSMFVPDVDPSEVPF